MCVRECCRQHIMYVRREASKAGFRFPGSHGCRPAAVSFCPRPPTRLVEETVSTMLEGPQSLQSTGSNVAAAVLCRCMASGGRYQCDSVGWRLGRILLRTRKTRHVMGFRGGRGGGLLAMEATVWWSDGSWSSERSKTYVASLNENLARGLDACW